MFQHGAADDLPGVLLVGQHDALVHDHALRGGAGRLPGHPDDVEVWSFVGIRLGSVCFITFAGGSHVNKTSVQGRSGQRAGAGHPGPHAVVETTGGQRPVRNILFLHGAVSLAQHRGGGGGTARHCAGYGVILTVIYDRGDSSFESGLFADI